MGVNSPSTLMAPTTGLRAGLIRLGEMSVQEVFELLETLELEGHRQWGELSDETQRRVFDFVEAARGESLGEPSPVFPDPPGLLEVRQPWSDRLERVRALLYLYALVRKPLEWQTEKLNSRLVSSVRAFLGLEPSPGPSRELLEGLRERLNKQEEVNSDEALAFAENANLFSMTELETEVLWLFIAPQLSQEFHWLLDGLMRRMTGGGMTLTFASEVVQLLNPDADALQRLWEPEGTLLGMGLVERGPLEGLHRVSSRWIEVMHLSGESLEIPREMSGMLTKDRAVPYVSTDDVLKDKHPWLSLFRKSLRERGSRFLVLGPLGTVAMTISRMLADAWSMNVLTLNLRLILSLKDSVWRSVMREVVLQRGVLILQEIDALGESSFPLYDRSRLIQMLSTSRAPLIIEMRNSSSSRLLLELMDTLKVTVLSVPMPDVRSRSSYWDNGLKAAGVTLTDGEHRKLLLQLRSYPFGADMINSAIDLSRAHIARGQSASEALNTASASMLNHRLGEMAARVKTLQSWDDLVVSDVVLEQIKSLLNFGKLSHKVLEEWGYGKKLSYGKGLSALFSGPSGTGKTMVAGLIAKDLGMDLYRVDLSKLVSKYIGETEQRLNVLFDEAATIGCALLFDEADSMFGKRTEVKSSTDRYANLEVNYLLQKLEEHEGMVLLTSNFPKSIDSAFMRRIRYRVHFPKPENSLRVELWRRMIPEEAPTEEDLFLKELGERYELSGGEIRNAVLRAALYAAADGRKLSADDLERSAQTEYRQLGHLIIDGVI